MNFKKYSPLIFVSLFSSLFTLLLAYFIFGDRSSKNSAYIPQTCWPTFDRQAPYTINGPLWIGFDKTKERWRYLKIPFSEHPSEWQRGLKDPGDPSRWTSSMGEIGYFNTNQNDVPGATHLNNKYDPATVPARYGIDDIMIHTGNFWIDKYESTIILMDGSNGGKRIDDPDFGGFSKERKGGNGFDVQPTAIAVSQRKQGSSGITYFIAEQTAMNCGKHLARNEQWQAAAGGTARSDATGMHYDGELWDVVNDKDISRYGVVGCAGSLWEWTASWGQYGEPNTGPAQNWYDWPGPGSYVEWDDKYDTYNDDIIIGLAGRSYTRQDSARYAKGLPSALARGGSWGDHNRAGIFALVADGAPSYYGKEVGFRCVK